MQSIILLALAFIGVSNAGELRRDDKVNNFAFSMKKKNECFTFAFNYKKKYV